MPLWLTWDHTMQSYGGGGEITVQLEELTFAPDGGEWSLPSPRPLYQWTGGWMRLHSRYGLFGETYSSNVQTLACLYNLPPI